MKIYIDNKEVLCNSKMTIKEPLSNTKSVILNNVYPKEWEQDKDYVSKFYMPKDYSKVKIIDDTKSGERTYARIINNVYFMSGRTINYTNSKIMAYSNYIMAYIPVVPNKPYQIKLKKTPSAGWRIYESNTTNLEEVATTLFAPAQGEYWYEITPTKKYIVFTKQSPTETIIECTDLVVIFPNNIVFSGYIKNSGSINLNPRYPHYSTLQALDYENFLSECDTLNYVLDTQSVSSAIKRIVEDLDGFFVGTIALEDDSEIAPYNCNNKTPYDVFDYLAEVTGSIWYSTTYDDNITLINFRSPDKCEQLDNLEYEENYFKENEILDIKYSYNTKDYRNKQTIVNENAISGIAQVENIVYMGTEMNTTYPIANIVSIKSGTKEYSVATNIQKSSGVYANFYYTYGGTAIEPYGKVGTGQVLTITYYSIVNSRQVAFNQTEVNRISEQTGSNGIISRYEKRTDTNNEVSLSQIAQTYLDYKGVPEITLTIKTTKDLFPIVGGRKIFFEAPLEDLKTNYLLTDKQVDMIVTGDQQVVFYTYTLSSSFNDENAINFFDNQRRKLEGTIQEGEYISRYIDLPSTTDIIFYDVSLQEISIPGDILDGELDIELLGNGGNTLNSKLNFVL